MTVSGTTGALPTQLPIKAGDAIGVNNPNDALVENTNPGATQVFWTLSPLPDGDTRAGLNGGGNEVLVQAVVEPDVDCDNAGDETQDNDLNDGPCKSKPKQTLSAKKKQKVSKATIT